MWSGVILMEDDAFTSYEQTNSGTGVLLMIFHHKDHTTFSELALRSNKIKCDENDHLESPFQINATQ